MSLLTPLSRIRAAAANRLRPAMPKNIIMKSIATITAVFRECSYPQLTFAKKTSWFKMPPIGTIILILTYLGFIFALEFIENDIAGAQHYTALGVRAAWLAVAQVPLLILLAGKKNLIGFVTGVSYERLNVLHRWVSRVLLLLVTLHFGSQSYGWNQYGLMQLEWSTDTCPPTGMAAYSILLWLNLSTLAPIRNFSYEFFVVQHILTFFGFIIAVMMHLPSTALYSRVYIYIPIGLYTLDRLIRTWRFAFNNVRPGHATLVAMDGGVTKIRIRNNQVRNWTPGSHVLLSIPRFGLGQSHPATIASIPSSHSNDLIFILKSHKGFTHRIMKSANASMVSPSPNNNHEAVTAQGTRIALIDGPYGASHADFAAFDTVVLISGSTGVTFTLPLFLDVAHRASFQRLPVRHIEFVWIIKNRCWSSWISEELCSAFKKIQAAGIEVAIRIFITSDDTFTESSYQTKEQGCRCDRPLDQCGCTNLDDLEKGDSDNPTGRESMMNNGATLNGTAINPPSTSGSASPVTARAGENPNSRISCATFKTGRPSFYSFLWDLADQAEGETGIAVCGPLGLSTTIRTTVAGISDQRAVHKGTGAQGIFLHVESFGW
jgi:ferric-chelate reductase